MAAANLETEQRHDDGSAQAVIDDLLPPAFDVIYPAIGGRLQLLQARGIVARTLVEHLNLVVADCALPASNSPEPEDAHAGMTRPTGDVYVNTFDRFSSQHGTRAQLYDRLTARMDDNALAANTALALIEMRTDLALVTLSRIELRGVGSLTCADTWRKDYRADHPGVHHLSDGAQGSVVGRRSRRWVLRSFADQLMLATAVRPVMPYRLHIPAITSTPPSRAVDEAHLAIATVDLNDANHLERRPLL